MRLAAVSHLRRLSALSVYQWYWATSKIRSASQGYVELKGSGEFMPGDDILSPFSGNRCLWYQCTVDRKQKQGKRTTCPNLTGMVMARYRSRSGELFITRPDRR